MKGYICAILFLMCGLDHFATQVQGNCQWGEQIISVGSYNLLSCKLLTCHLGGITTVKECPSLTCSTDEVFVGYTNNAGSEFPDCCPQALCRKRN
ncbi:venom peptide HsVx1 isoform X1 [Monomorium pharaonis]|uniref:venom peptide HsVx1 isoform X1 n=1 Tax=Monomorium pharaonis TaxID=307658 RepID=UPI00102E1AF1|nr:venom peptide HsVx1 isoform X1 [Monomorium pharaonis]XP_036148553.1 venom peptide HsVx1 isoform X1 [Monomorium pharaonis]